MDVVFLGTGAMKPTPRRFPSSLMLRHKGEIIMFDAGEGIQVRVSQSGFSPMKVNKIFITHFHGDHFYGLPGMIFTMSQAERTEELVIYGPEESESFVHRILSLGYGRITFPIHVEELKPGSVVQGDGYSVTAFETDHGPPGLGYVFREDDSFNVDVEKMKKFGFKPDPKFKLLKQGKTVELGGHLLKPEEWLIPAPGDSLAYTGDTRYSKAVVRAVRGVTVLVHEATHLSEDSKDFREHSSAKEAARAAKEAEVGYLFLTHISPRYKDATPLLEEAREVFPRTYLPKDLDRVSIKKGEVRFLK